MTSNAEQQGTTEALAAAPAPKENKTEPKPAKTGNAARQKPQVASANGRRKAGRAKKARRAAQGAKVAKKASARREGSKKQVVLELMRRKEGARWPRSPRRRGGRTTAYADSSQGRSRRKWICRSRQ
jgi:hypothetical protein